MTVLNFIGGGSPGVSASFTDNWVKSTSGVALPTTGTLADNGNKPIYVATAQCFWAGRGASRTLSLSIGGKSSGNKTVAAAGSASNSGNLAIGYVSQNGGTVEVKIDGNGSFYFGRATSTGSAVDSYGTTFGGALSGSVDYYTVPTSPTSVSVAQANLENAVTVTWSAPSSNGGYATAPTYRVRWSYNSNFSGSTDITTGSTATSYKITGLNYGSTVYVKVAAINTAATQAGTTSVYSSSASAYLVPPNLSLDGWGNFGTLANNTFTLTHTVIPALLPKLGMLREATASATGGSYTTGNFGISKTYTNLTAGRQYIVAGKAILLTAGMAGNIYRFAVQGIGNGSSVTLTSTTVGATIPSYTFTATSSTHTVEIELAETFTVAATGKQESVAFYDFTLTRVATDLPFRVQDNNENVSLLDHFDLATQSVGATWWIDKTNTTKFAQDFNYVNPTCTFSDTVGAGYLYMNDIEVTYDTSTIVNQIAFSNVGRRPIGSGSDQFQSYTVNWLDSDATSISNWGARKQELKTNLWTQESVRNLLMNPNLAYSADFNGSGTSSVTFTRQRLSDMATGATGFLSSGTTQPVAGVGGFVLRAAMGATNDPTVIYVHGGDNAISGVTNYGSVSVTPSTQYTASVYLRAGVGHATSLTGRCDIRWYTEAGATISTSTGTATTITATGWTRRTITATAPANARFAVVFSTFLYGGASNAGFRYYSTAAQLEAAATASTWFSGDTTDDASFIYEWEGQPGASSSIRYVNVMDTRTGELLTNFANPSVTVKSLTWNTAQNSVIAATLDIGSIVRIIFRGTTSEYRVVGISHDITPDRWLMTVQVAKDN